MFLCAYNNNTNNTNNLISKNNENGNDEIHEINNYYYHNLDTSNDNGVWVYKSNRQNAWYAWWYYSKYCNTLVETEYVKFLQFGPAVVTVEGLTIDFANNTQSYYNN